MICKDILYIHLFFVFEVIVSQKIIELRHDWPEIDEKYLHFKDMILITNMFNY